MKTITKLHEIKVSYQNKSDKESITTSKQAFEICKDAYSLSESNSSLREYFFIIFLNRSNRVIGYFQLSSGGLTGTVADLRLAYSIALKCLACSILLSHNHPSGQRQPSDSDINLTKKFVKAGEILDIHVLDHIILAGEDYYSMADNGQI